MASQERKVSSSFKNKFTFSNKKLLAKIVALCLASFFLGAVFVEAQGGTTYTISAGPYPSGVSYTIYANGLNYYAKNKYGVNVYTGTNAGVIIESALNATGVAGGGTVYVTAGLYPIAAMHLGSEGYYYGVLMSAPNLKLIGEGKGTILQLTVGNSRIITLTYQCVKCEVSNLCVDGQNLNVAPTMADTLIAITTNYDCKVTGVWSLNGGDTDGMGAFQSFRAEFAHNVVSTSQHGIVLDNCSRCLIDTCQVTDVDGTGYLIQEASYDNKITNSIAYDTGQFTFEISLYRGFSPQRNSISSCSGILSAWSGLSLFGASENIIENCHFINNTQQGIYITGNATASSAYNIINSCHVKYNSQNGLLEDAFGLGNIIASSAFLDNIIGNMSTVVSTYVSSCWNGTGTWIT